MPENSNQIAPSPVTLEDVLKQQEPAPCLQAHEEKPAVAVNKHGRPLTPAQLAFKGRHRRRRSSFFNPVTGVREEL